MPEAEVLGRLADQARNDIGEFLEFRDGLRTPILNLAQAQDKLHLIKKIIYGKDGKITIELHDSQSALVHLGRHHGSFTDKLKVEDDTLSDSERVKRLAAIFDQARDRRD